MAMRRGSRRGVRAAMHRLLALALLLASLLVPPFAEGAGAGPAGSGSIVAAGLAEDGAAARPHALAHAGAHCACQSADRLAGPAEPVPAMRRLALGPAHGPPPPASLGAEPPARPPRG
ncbi:hypothetical protein SAMN04487779_101622 [Belnapia rosea]|uniref:DUF2946 domain-containing protein n=2 Tax=Belnapia rosea TaxID=938405 RepID=A0A1G6ZCK9_9PROT|nr:hypothetical protein SAMN04487779_101622 [Belnapia rosea]